MCSLHCISVLILSCPSYQIMLSQLCQVCFQCRCASPRRTILAPDQSAESRSIFATSMSMPKQAIRDRPLTEAATCYLDKYLNWDSPGPRFSCDTRHVLPGRVPVTGRSGCQIQQCTLLVSLRDACVWTLTKVINFHCRLRSSIAFSRSSA